eukprot:7223632-Alexandrium_andersonii.AAC.1
MTSTANCRVCPVGPARPPPLPSADHAWRGGPATWRSRSGGRGGLACASQCITAAASPWLAAA